MTLTLLTKDITKLNDYCENVEKEFVEVEMQVS